MQYISFVTGNLRRGKHNYICASLWGPSNLIFLLVSFCEIIFDFLHRAQKILHTTVRRLDLPYDFGGVIFEQDSINKLPRNNFFLFVVCLVEVDMHLLGISAGAGIEFA